MRRLGLVIAGAFLGLAALRCASFEERRDDPTGGDGGADGTATADASASDDGGVDTSCGERDFANDSKHCGRCNHSCAGGDCVDGACQPFVLMEAKAPGEIARAGSRVFVEIPTGENSSTIVWCPRSGCGANPKLVIAGVANVKSMIFTDGRLYFATADTTAVTNTLESCDPDDCTSTRTAVVPAVSSTFHPFTPLRLSEGKLVFGQVIVSAGEVRRSLDGGAAVEPIAKTSCLPERVAVSATDLSWTCYGGATVYGCGVPCTVDGGSPSITPQPTGIGQIERSGPHLVWEDGAGKLTILTSQGSTSLPARGTGPIAMSNADLFFQNGAVGRIETCQLPACANTRSIATTTAAAIVADENAVFWTIPAQNVVMSVVR